MSLKKKIYYKLIDLHDKLGWFPKIQSFIRKLAYGIFWPDEFDN